MRKFQALGLQVAYRSDEEAKQFLRATPALAFVPIVCPIVFIFIDIPHLHRKISY